MRQEGGARRVEEGFNVAGGGEEEGRKAGCKAGAQQELASNRGKRSRAVGEEGDGPVAQQEVMEAEEDRWEMLAREDAEQGQEAWEEMLRWEREEREDQDELL